MPFLVTLVPGQMLSWSEEAKNSDFSYLKRFHGDGPFPFVEHPVEKHKYIPRIVVETKQGHSKLSADYFLTETGEKLYQHSSDKS